MTTTAPNTTRSSYRPQAKHWMVTINNWVPDEEKAFDNPQVFSYAVVGREKAETTGTPHLQGYICCHNQLRLTALKKIFPRADLRIKKSKSCKRASDYCKKGEQPKADWKEKHENSLLFGLNASFKEYGVLPKDQQTEGGFKFQEIYDQALDYAREGRIDEINSKVIRKFINS